MQRRGHAGSVGGGAVGGGAVDRGIGGSESQAPASAAAAAATVSLQLQWAPQAQFAGYFAADKQGYYKAENLTVTMVPGGPDVVPQQVGSAADGPEFTIAGSRRCSRRARAARTSSTSPRSSSAPARCRSRGRTTNITDPCKLAGKKVGVWDFGNEFEVTAGS